MREKFDLNPPVARAKQLYGAEHLFFNRLQLGMRRGDTMNFRHRTNPILLCDGVPIYHSPFPFLVFIFDFRRHADRLEQIVKLQTRLFTRTRSDNKTVW